MNETFGQALRRLRSRGGLTQEQLGRLVGYTDKYLSDLERDRRRPPPWIVESLDKALAADGELAAAALAQHAQEAVPRLPEWDDARMVAGVSGTVRPDQTMVAELAGDLAANRLAEDETGARSVLVATLEQMATVATLRAEARGTLHDDLLSLEAQVAQFLGWIYQDLGDRKAAGQWYARAMERAAEAGDANMVASVLSMRSNTAWGAGDIRRAVRLGEAAVRPKDASPGVLALSHQQAARAYAAAGERTEAERALGTAAELNALGVANREGEPPWVYFQDERRLELQRALVLVELGEYRQAVDIMRRTINQLPTSYRRDRGNYLSRLAVALVGAGEREEATAVAVKARQLAEDTGSVRTLEELDRLNQTPSCRPE